jgi:hypothetical protein
MQIEFTQPHQKKILINFPLKNKKNRLLLPVWGSAVFLCLYLIATLNYPGGSQADAQAKGFNWQHNYWCNLLNDTAINGEQNTAKPVAIAAMAVLCITLLLFWYLFPKYAVLKNRMRRMIQISGLLSVIIIPFLHTGAHDLVINTAGFFGVIAIVGTLFSLYKLEWLKLFWFGIFNLLSVAVNNILYYDKEWIRYLPVVQKFTFLFFLLWFSFTCIQLYRTQTDKNEQAA